MTCFQSHQDIWSKVVGVRTFVLTKKVRTFKDIWLCSDLSGAQNPCDLISHEMCNHGVAKNASFTEVLGWPSF